MARQPIPEHVVDEVHARLAADVPEGAGALPTLTREQVRKGLELLGGVLPVVGKFAGGPATRYLDFLARVVPIALELLGTPEGA